jgi:hypothetical protein
MRFTYSEVKHKIKMLGLTVQERNLIPDMEHLKQQNYQLKLAFVAQAKELKRLHEKLNKIERIG